MASTVNPVARLGRLLREERSEITSIYVYALLSGLIQLSLPLGIQSIIGFVLGGNLSTSLVILIIVVVFGVACNGLLQLSQMRINERIQQKIFVRYAFAFDTHLPRLNLGKVDGYYLPELVNRFFDVPSLQKSMAKILLDFPLAVTQILLGLILLAFYHPAFIAFGIVLLLVLITIFYATGNRGFQTSLEKSNYKYAVAGWLEEMARVIQPFKFWSHTGLHTRHTDNKVTGYLKARTAHFGILLLQYKVLIGFKVLITAAMLIVGCLLLLEQQINIGQFVAAEIVIIIVINSVEKLIVNLDSVYSALTSVEKINKLLDKPTEEDGSLQMDAKPISVSFRDVTFGYDDGEAVIRNLSFAVEPAAKACISGPNGSGKSTVLKLLTGGYHNFQGAVLLNGVPIGNYNLRLLRSQMGVLLSGQDVFAGTLWENLTMGNDQIDKSYLAQLCEQVGLTNYVAAQPEGFDAEIGPMGIRLPRGVVQRILLVRCLLPRPSLLLLEEPLASIEGDDRQRIADLLTTLPATTVIAVSNQPEIVNGCQQTIHLNPKQA